MRSAIILNSTQTYEHIGCYLTMAGLKSTLQEAGIKTVYEIGTNESAIDDATAFFNLNPDALIVINGEGTFHSDQPYSLRLLEAVKGEEHRVLLLNSQFTNMNATAINCLRKLALVQVRNKFDQMALRAEGVDALFCPDMLFASGIEQFGFTVINGFGKIFTDSHRKDVTEAIWSHYLAERTKKGWINFHYRPLGSPSRVERMLNNGLFRSEYALMCLGARLGNRIGRFSLSETLRHFAAADEVITGRYHAVCLAIAFGKPLKFFASNTAKIERLLADVTGTSIEAINETMELRDYTKERTDYLDETSMALNNLKEKIAKI